MNARAINSAAGVILAAIERGRVPAGIACALDAAGLLNSPERAADLVALRARVTELEQQLGSASTTPRLDGRLGILLDAIRTHGGEWTTRRVQQLYRMPSIDTPLRSAARRDLHALYALGHLVEHDLKGRRHYTLAKRSKGA